MEKEYQELLLVIKSTEERLEKLKKVAAAYNSPELKKKLVGTNDFSLDEIDQYKIRLEEKEKLIRKTESFSNVGRWSYIFETREMLWSHEAYKIFEFPEGYDGNLNEYYMACLDEKTALRIPEQAHKLKTCKGSMIMNHTIQTSKGNTKLLTFTSDSILNSADEIIGVEGFVKDITEQIVGKKGLDNFFNLSSDLHCIVHMDKYFLRVSPAWSKLLGYSEKELLSKSFIDFIHPDDLQKSETTLHDFDKFGIAPSFENRYVTKSGEVVYLSWSAQMDEENDLAYCTVRDITKSKMERDELLSDLSEKDLLLREIHHRVKNNLQIISSLLSLQAGANSEQSKLTELYEDSRNRIKSMAAIHEMFYQSDELDKIEFGKYLNKLIGDLSLSVLSGQKLINFSLDVETVYVNLDTAIPLGLLINEIVTNSIKYGKDENGDVEIFVKLKVLEGNKLELVIGDNGRNSPKNILNQESDSLGVMLISSLVEQINGEIIQLEEFEGTVYQIVFIKQ